MSRPKDEEAENILDDLPAVQTYEDFKQQLRDEQSGLSREEIAAKMRAEAEATFDPETAVAPEHNWIRRGIVMSCEGAKHPSHRHFLAKR